MPGWFQELHGTHTPETEEYGIRSTIYRRNRPFHPQRLHALGGEAGVVPEERFVERSLRVDLRVDLLRRKQVPREDRHLDPHGRAVRQPPSKFKVWVSTLVLDGGNEVEPPRRRVVVLVGHVWNQAQS